MRYMMVFDWLFGHRMKESIQYFFGTEKSLNYLRKVL